MSLTTFPSLNAPPPDYAPSQPQILIAPLPDSASFFWGRTVQGEVYVKGLGERGGQKGVKSLSVQLQLSNHLSNHPTVPIHTFAEQTLYPPPSTSLASPTAVSSSTVSSVEGTSPSFSPSHRFSIPLPSSIRVQSPFSSSAVEHILPGTLNLSSANRGEIRWSLVCTLTLLSGQAVSEQVRVEGTPQEVGIGPSASGPETNSDTLEEVEERLEKDGVTARLVLDQATPRLGDLLRLGVEVRPKERQKTGVAGLSSQPNPAETLRPLRRVRVELYRQIKLLSSPSNNSGGPSSSSSAPSSTTLASAGEHLTLLYASGKSLRYPGTARSYPPLRVLFTVPTVQLGNVADQTWGEISMTTTYHVVSFFIRATIGFGEPAPSAPGAASTSAGNAGTKDWILQREIVIRPKIWNEPREVVIERGQQPALGLGVEGMTVEETEGSSSNLTDEQIAREEYRQKGRDVVGQQGTYRHTNDNDGEAPPPSFDDAGPGPSSRAGNIDAIASAIANVSLNGHGEEGGNESGSGNGNGNGNNLPTFLESEAQMRSGEAPLPTELVRSERLVPVPVAVDGEGEQMDGDGEFVDRSTWVGRRGSLGGELGTWIEYDGYETFSVQPPSASASYGVGGSMDPPQEGEDGGSVDVVGGIAARLGLDGSQVGTGLQGIQGMALMEQLGLGEGTRVVDLHDDLPPGIDEPSLPALPDFTAYPPAHTARPHPHPQNQSIYHSPPRLPLAHPHPHDVEEGPHDHPPSFDASQAAAASGANANANAPQPLSAAPTIPVPHMSPTRRASRTLSLSRGNAPAPAPVTVPSEAPPGYGADYAHAGQVQEQSHEGEAGLPPYS